MPVPEDPDVEAAAPVANATTATRDKDVTPATKASVPHGSSIEPVASVINLPAITSDTTAIPVASKRVTRSANAPTAKITDLQDGPTEPVNNGTYRSLVRFLALNVWRFSPDCLVSLEESDGSASDYGEQHEAVLAKRRKKAANSQAVSDTESEDAQLDRELSAEAVPETSDKPSPRTKTTGGKSAKQSKPVDGAELDGEHDEDESNDKWEVISGPLSKEAHAEAQQLGALVAEMAEKIARKYKKSRREVVLAAGLSVRAARTRNPHNMFRKWYAHHHSRGESEYGTVSDSDGLLTFRSVIQRVRRVYD